MKKNYYLLLLALTFTILGFSQPFSPTYIYNPTAYAGNGWLNGLVPSTVSEENNIIIEEGHYTFTSNVIGWNININTGASATIEPGVWVLAHSDLIVDNNLTLQSTATEYAQVFAESYVEGEMTYELWVKNGPRSNFISAPFYGQTFGDFALDNTNSLYRPDDSNTRRFGPWDKDTGTYLEWDTSDDASENLTSGIGYHSATQISSNNILSFTGENEIYALNITARHTPLTQASNWNLLGNPYSTYMSVVSFMQTNGSKLQPGKEGIYLYTASGWVVLNASTAVNSIPPGQGFYIAVTTDRQRISFRDHFRTLSVTSTTGFNSNSRGEIIEDENNPLYIYPTAPFIKINVSANSVEQHYTEIYFNDDTTLGQDSGYDTTIYGNNASGYTMFTKLVDFEEFPAYKLAIQTLPATALENEGITIALGLIAPKGEQLTIDLTELTLDDTAIVYLEDTKTNTWTALKDQAYTFTTDEKLTGLGRFNLHVTNEERLSIDDSSILKTLHFISGNNSINIKGLLEKSTKLSVFDMQGRLINSTTISNTVNEYSVNTSNYGSGIYIVKVKTPAGKNIAKRVILK